VKVHSEELVQAFADPLVIRHPCGHTVPKLGEIRFSPIEYLLISFQIMLSPNPTNSA